MARLPTARTPPDDGYGCGHSGSREPVGQYAAADHPAEEAAGNHRLFGRRAAIEPLLELPRLLLARHGPPIGGAVASQLQAISGHRRRAVGWRAWRRLARVELAWGARDSIELHN